MFWEAFPACGGTARTTYMFAYADADPRRPSFEVLACLYRPSACHLTFACTTYMIAHADAHPQRPSPEVT